MDAVERMLKDLISVQENPFVPEEITAEKKSVPSQPEPAEGSDLYQKLLSETESDPLLEKPEHSSSTRRIQLKKFVINRLEGCLETPFSRS